LKFINDTKKNVYKNEGNSTSMNTYVLNNKELKNLKNELLKSVENYFVKIIDTDNNINPYITQSWINFTEETEFHHTHEHPNSYLSAVFYINADKEHDKIKFYKTGYQTILPSVREYNHYNSLAWSFPVETGDIVIFPSYLSHCVEFKKGKNVRTSLAFNIFIKGKIGSERGLTELTL
jgi:uncharacterized protein (TIGR02466 family)